MKNYFRQFCYVLVVICVLSACQSQKKIVYFQDKSGSSSPSEGNPMQSPGNTGEFLLKVYKQDFITVQFFIDNPEAVPGISSTMDQRMTDTRTFYERSFIVDNNGMLELPLVGRIKVDGLTLNECKEAIIKEYKEYITNPVIVIKKLSFRITVLGEVNKPGQYYIPNESVTISEALGIAGDLTQFGSRTDIKIFRKANGKFEEIILDLTNKDFLNTPLNYLNQDDVLYIRPLRRRAAANAQPIIQIISTAVSSAILVATFFAIRTN
ncbi:MAG: polysaccharide biosynthesis/export family protein [Bacteroidetes bacterium]|nr:polysaccharide biosynthesis/export family protein [Bacteroidota bacterium]